MYICKLREKEHRPKEIDSFRVNIKERRTKYGKEETTGSAGL